MILAVIFDLDGTLVQTEKLKAQSYAQAAMELAQGDISEQDVIDAFTAVVGLSRQEIAQYLLERFDLMDTARERMDAYNVSTPWQTFVQIRMRIYESMLEDPLVIVKHRCPYNLDLLTWARETRYKTGLITEAAAMRPRLGSDPILFTTKVVIRGLARRIQGPDDEIAHIDAMLRELVIKVAPSLLELYSTKKEK